jgi:hypothetical protein
MSMSESSDDADTKEAVIEVAGDESRVVESDVKTANKSTRLTTQRNMVESRGEVTTPRARTAAGGEVTALRARTSAERDLFQCTPQYACLLPYLSFLLRPHPIHTLCPHLRALRREFLSRYRTNSWSQVLMQLRKVCSTLRTQTSANSAGDEPLEECVFAH